MLNPITATCDMNLPGCEQTFTISIGYDRNVNPTVQMKIADQNGNYQVVGFEVCLTCRSKTPQEVVALFPKSAAAAVIAASQGSGTGG